MISIVCVFNNRGILESYLLKSLENQTSNYELTMVDNTEGKFESASNALNWGAKEAKGKYIMFVHQDVDLCSKSWLENAEKLLDALPNLGIAGVAGARSSETSRMREVITNIKHGIPPKCYLGAHPLRIPEKVQTLDECLVVVPKNVFDMLPFDEETCDDWHLYTVDYCLSVAKLGLGVYVIPMFIYHGSIGSLPDGYYQTLGKLLSKHRSDTKEVYTTTVCWSTSYSIILQRVTISVRRILGRLFTLFLGERTAQRLAAIAKKVFGLK